uniref:Signal transduction protein containing GAF domain n=1 Tax=Polaromonas sp. H6N TaxID=1840293 RepID=A0A2S1FJ82_9BURK|nr:cache domain-containing protein [Polaromonas sp. H6N]AWD72247.1 signal transduction protein containing GAF domain [Polaromonas sp. H6N]
MNASVSPPRLSTSLVLLLVVALMPLFGLVTYTSLQSQQDSLAHAHDDLLSTARLTALRHEGTVESARQLLGAIASSPVVKNQDLPGCMGYLKALHGKYPFYANLGLVDIKGNLVCHAANIKGATFLGDRFYFKQALATNSFVIGEYIIGRTNGRPAITFSMPVFDDKGDLSGVAFAALELEKLVGDQHLASPFPGSVIVTDRNGALVGADTSVSSQIGTQAFDSALFTAVKALPDQTFEVVDKQERTIIYAAAGVGNGAWPGLFVTASVPKEAVLAPAKRQLALALTLLGLFAAIGVFGARYVANRTIVEPTRRLLKQVNALLGSDGVQPADPVGQQNELAGLTSAFNQMATILKARETARDKADRVLATRLRQQEAIAQLSVEVASASMLESVLQSATRCVADALAADLCNVLQLTADERYLQFVASVGCKPGLVGTAMLAVDALSQASYTLRAGEPVLVEDLRTESRFEAWALLAEHRVVSSLSVTIQLQGKPWGVLGVYSRSARGFAPKDTYFMQSVASVAS